MCRAYRRLVFNNFKKTRFGIYWLKLKDEYHRLNGAWTLRIVSLIRLFHLPIFNLIIAQKIEENL